VRPPRILLVPAIGLVVLGSLPAAGRPSGLRPETVAAARHYGTHITVVDERSARPGFTRAEAENRAGGGAVTLDRDFWEGRWSQALREHGDKLAKIPPNAHLTGALAGLRPGRALDAGCGHGAETLWLAARGWRVTAVDFSATALGHARSTAEAVGADVAGRVEWVEGDLATWLPQAGHYDLVVCLYVHVAGSVEEMVQRMAAGVGPGGTLLLVGHRPIDPATGAPTPAAGQVQVSVEEAVRALGNDGWELLVAEDRPRAAAGTGVDSVVCARRGTGRTGG
jgi:SAM-dependent methyltransferase